MKIKNLHSYMFKAYQLFLPILAVIITVSIVCFPDEAFNAALEGLNTWFAIVLPALLPFFIGSQLLMGLGVVHFMGVLLEPFMRPLFNVPGAGSFVMAMGLASGYPVGSMLTGKLVKNELCNTWEAERLMSFTNTADPLFMIGAVAVGMFKDARLGIIIALSHYISAIILGLIMRFYAKNKEITPLASTFKKQGGVFLRATHELLRARKEDGRPFGQLLGDCIKDSVNSLLMVLGFIVLFSVIIRTITVAGFIDILIPVIETILKAFGFDISLAPAILSGFFEITLGTQLASTASAPLMQRVIIVSSIIAWSGLSVHFQVISMVSDTKIKIAPYIFARLLHAFLAGFVAYVLMITPIYGFESLVIPAFAMSPQTTSESWFNIFKTSTEVFVLLFILILLTSIITHLMKNLNIIGFKVVKKK
ncbi:Sporulation integral membrane protein YlbJ [Tepidanaerobacter acetatoxydans Re1]|uniref:Sporulation integral membrane protein YlbJ n=1 Tax=Tepidanaerobacter acetatoxydans (strain DSM 21804 / JCM 16047 / Re1) TaxID=1209989 RepID=F4LVL1_TEPAE|nr:sporulation integral membrane protein YlbJ [Tepidanaerobacter acetatoxydans]AEE91597.1 sporulation integral membrane protein YlbJ [Tepidanaerobacter acetatoxydans Re1]CCP26328.1 Sporulation integral membrane protein YlbJ [Tepidanaerobacter acetatoxydans Re1]